MNFLGGFWGRKRGKRWGSQKIANLGFFDSFWEILGGEKLGFWFLV